MTQLRTKLTVALRSAFINPPSIVGVPVIDGVNAAANVTFSAISSVSGTPPPTVVYALFKNGVSVASGTYAAVNNSYSSTLFGDVLTVVVTASNGFGVPAVVTSAPLTVGTTQSFIPTILAAPVIGQALFYAMPGYAGSVSSQQWYRNKNNSGPVLIPGATSPSYTPTKTSALGDSDVGSFFSVHVATPTGFAKSQEFTSANTVISQTGVLTTASPQAGANYAGRIADGITVLTVAKIRMTATNGATTNYIETILAPGAYPAGGTTYGDPALIVAGGTQFNCSLYTYQSLCSPSCIDTIADATPSTTTRPSASTGIGFFNKGGELYDANGNKTRLRGFNRNHYDANPPGASVGVFNGKANVHRLNMYLYRDWLTINKPLMDDMITTAHKVIPVPTTWYVNGVFQGTVSSKTLTVLSMTSGVICVAPQFSSSISGGGFVAAGVASTTIITAQLTNTNASGIPFKEGTYSISNAYTIASPISMSYTNSTTGLQNPEALLSAAQAWCDQYANFAPYERWMLLGLGNEWGPSGSVSNTVWRDTCITAVQMLRAAGYKCPIHIDAPGSGQDNGASGHAWTLLNHAAAVLAADSQSNTMFDLHVYGGYQAGVIASVAQALRTLATSAGVTFLVGEFGPANLNAGIGQVTTAQLLETLSVLEGCQLGHIIWAWDDPANAVGNSYSYVPYALCQNAGSNFYATSDPTQLTIPGQQYLLDTVNGLAAKAVPATVFP